MVNITDNDTTPDISIDDVIAGEGDGTATFTIGLSVPYNQDVTVQAATTDGTAAAGQDYTATPPTTVTILAGETSVEVVVALLDDVMDEDDETFLVDLSNPTNGNLVDVQGIGTIIDNDEQPTLSIDDVTVNEGDGSATFTIGLSAVSGRDITVQTATINGSAQAGDDYTPLPTTTITIPAGALSATVDVTVIDDVLNEADESFFVNLTAPTNGTLLDSQGIGVIVDNDPVPTLWIDDVSASEGDAAVTFTISLSAVTGQVVTVVVETADGSAVGGDDYVTVPPTTVTIPIGGISVTFDVAIIDDSLDEASESFFLGLTNPGNAVLMDFEGIGTIIDNDPLPALSVDDVTVAEGGGSATFTVGLSAASGHEISVQVATADDTAIEGNDYIGVLPTLIAIPAGNYTVTLRSGSDAFKDLATGELLDGNADGTPGDAYVATSQLDAAQPRVLSIPDFTRGPSQPVDVPATGIDLPIMLSDGTGVEAVDFSIVYDPELLNITNVVAVAPDGITVNMATPGIVTMTLWSTAGLPSGWVQLVRLIADVPAGDPYGKAHVLHMVDLELNDGVIAASNDATDGLITFHDSTATVVGRHVFYNNSIYDGNDPAANAADDAAIATDKQALLPGETATLANYTSYSRGINGIMVDIQGLADPIAVGDDDFSEFRFRYGNDNTPDDWPQAVLVDPADVDVRDLGGGVHRVSFTWADNIIPNRNWLQVTVLADAATGLAENDVFYFVASIGENTGDFIVDYADAFDVIWPLLLTSDAVGVDHLADVNRDGRIDYSDVFDAVWPNLFAPSSLEPITPAAAPAARTESTDSIFDENLT